jgi:putative phosphoribosyl transferase
VFPDRCDAGRQLAVALRDHKASGPVIIGLPRGGVPVAAEVAERLGAPLDIIVVRKLGCPWRPELGIGALAEGGIRVINEVLVRELDMTQEQLEEVTAREEVELTRRVRRYRGDRPPIDVTDRSVIIVDDGLATGYTARAAIEALRQHGAARTVIAVPVAPEDEAARLRDVADDVIAVITWPWFFAIGDAYDDFGQLTDEDVVSILQRAEPWLGASS